MKKVVIIGAGIAGLTCGIYARINGFDTEIYEMHTIPGGECTGWDRGGYHFDGCIHWLVGSKPGPGFHEIWRDTGALDDSVDVLRSEIFSRYEEDSEAVNLYTDAETLRRHLTGIAPGDAKEIAGMCALIRKLGKFGMPMDKPMDKMTIADGIRYAARNIGNLGAIGKYRNMTTEEFTDRFESPLLRRALLSVFRGDYTSMALFSTLGGMNDGDCGYPMGGSRALALRMEARYRALGGRVFYRSRVDKILDENGKAAGIRLAEGTRVNADYVVSCADGYDTFMHMLDDKYTPDVYRNLFSRPRDYPTITSVLVFAGIDTEIPFEYRNIVVRRSEHFVCGSVTTRTDMILHYGFDPAMAPPGKTVLACYYDADYDHWNELYKDPERYAAEKKRLEQDAVAVMIRRYPGAEGKIEVTDVVTPMTYERFCNAWRGSWMTWATAGKDAPQYFPGILPGLENFIIAGMWTMPPGGLPGAGAAGRFAAHRLCLQNGIAFRRN